MAARVAILIGNRRFAQAHRHGEWESPSEDVGALSDLLSNPDIGAFRVHEILDPTTTELVDGIEEHLLPSGPDSVGLVYYAGGSVIDHSGRLFLTTADTELSSLSTSAVSIPFLRYLLEKSGFRYAVVVLDCCYVGRAGHEYLGKRVSDQLEFLAAGVGPEFHVLASSVSIRSMEEREDTAGMREIGTLTRVLVEGLDSGAADGDGDARISFSELAEYLERRMPNKRPVWVSTGAGQQVLMATTHEPVPRRAGEPSTVAERELARGRHSWAPWFGLAALATVLLAVVIWAQYLDRPTGSVPELPAANIPTFDWTSAALVQDLASLRRLASRQGWIEHRADSATPLVAYPTLLAVAHAPEGYHRTGVLELGPRAVVVLSFEAEVRGIAVHCSRQLNLGEVRVRLVDGSEHAFSIATYFPEDDFYGFLAPAAIDEVRIETGTGTLLLESLYLYADRTHARR